MEKLSIEQKATRYDLAIEAAKSIYNNMKESGNFGGMEDLEVIFPELAESEDERIRKAISDILLIDSDEIREILDANNILMQDIDAWLEKQGQKPQGKSALEADKEVKIDNQNCTKPNVKVEPKFKVGDWVVNQLGEVWHIDSLDKKNYQVSNQKGNYNYFPILKQDKMHLWTFQDAKDGDILATKKGNPFIYNKNRYNNGLAYYYVGLGVNKELTLKGPHNMLGHFGKLCSVFPATKEQRELLFQKMKESGYKWENNQLEEINANGDYVDLCLPSGTLWAKCNLGAEKETDFGNFFQWGDTQGYSGVDEHQFGWDDYRYGSSKNFTKYNKNNTKLILDNEDDPVFVATKGKFKSPTKEQLKELIGHTNHEWTIIDGVKGMKFWKMGTEDPTDSGSYIFIPAAGEYLDGNHFDVDFLGCIWSSSYNESFASRAWSMCFDAGDIYVSDSSRCNGFSVRGVLNK